VEVVSVNLLASTDVTVPVAAGGLQFDVIGPDTPEPEVPLPDGEAVPAGDG
jgi:hypothetical protein